MTTDYSGVNQTNPLPGGFHEKVTAKAERHVYWTEPGLKITRLRFLSDPGFDGWDVSYCFGQLPSGEYVRVQLPFQQLRKFNRPINKQLVEWANQETPVLRLKLMGIFDVISTLN